MLKVLYHNVIVVKNEDYKIKEKYSIKNNQRHCRAF